MKTYEFSRIGLPRLFVTFPRLGWADPPVFRTHSWETDPPHRFAPTVLGFYLLPLPRAIAFGWWHDTEVESLTLELKNRMEIEAANAAYDRWVLVHGDLDRDEFEQMLEAQRVVD